ncbi:MAG: DEAD/DEAH box helicase [Muribaculaceae bacterium]|nr:DEAD/DEAH box helicase [Muribaculaceae bacterium]
MDNTENDMTPSAGGTLLFDSILSALTPLSSRNAGGTLHHENPVFTLTLSEGRPFLEFPSGYMSAPPAMSLPDRQLYNEMMRISRITDVFGITSSATQNVSIPLWENPYLVHLMRNGCTIAAPDGVGVLGFSDSPASLSLRIVTAPELPKAEIRLMLQADDTRLADLVFLSDTAVLCADTVYTVPSVGPNFGHISQLIAPVFPAQLEAFLTIFLSYVQNVTPSLNDGRTRQSADAVHSVPMLYLEKVAIDKALYLRASASLEFLGNLLPPDFQPVVAAIINGNDITLHNVKDCDISERTDRLEKAILDSAPDRTARKEIYREGNFFIVPEATAAPFLLRNLPAVLEDFRLVGSEKLKEYRIVATSPKLNLRLSSGIDFLEGEGDVTIGTDTFTISELLRQYSTQRYVQLSDGNRGILDEDYINRLRRIFRRRDKDGKIRITIFDLPEVDRLLERKLTGPFAARSRDVLEGFNRIPDSPMPEIKVNATLRPYQEQGVKWLCYLYRNRLGGCLADDMGLGKTLQAIALLTTVYPGAARPSMIVMPRSLLFNWEKELTRFAPQLTFHTYYGSDRDLKKALEADIILTTYAVARNDIESLKDQPLECVILDESQHIKTITTQTATAICLLNAQHRFALSGTPMENNLTELYSLFRFLNPTMFGSIDDFNASYTMPIQRAADKEAAESLRRRIFPFILRRLKRDVLSDLPERIDQTMYVEMSAPQQRLYNERRLSFRQQIEEEIAREGINKSRFLLFQALNELRRIASVPESLSDGQVTSPKIDDLLESLQAAVGNGHKSVVFFNFIAGIEILATHLQRLGIGYVSMTGSSSANDRKRIVERFQSDPDCMVMLLTLKVGGTGLNLTAADTVYIVEPWWNKAAEEQAINRLHRIGQKHTVSSYSMITVGTIEEKMLQLQSQKSQLIDSLISTDSADAKRLSESDIDFILS